MAAEKGRCRLCLISPADENVDACVRLVSAALSGGDVAALIVTADPSRPELLQSLSEALMPIAEARGVATLVHNDTRVAGRVRADGVHVDTGIDDLAAAVAAAKGKRMVGAGGVTSRHDAMLLSEAEPDYLFFGLLDGDRSPEIFDKAFELAAWWSEVAIIPAVVMGGSMIACVDQALDAAIDFVALRRAVWDDPRGPAAAVGEANARLARTTEPVA
jgi:thiamine-phosphate pyrophosphorylase